MWTFLTTDAPQIVAIDSDGQAMHIITPNQSTGVAASSVSGTLSSHTITFSFSHSGKNYSGSIPIIGTAIQGDCTIGDTEYAVLGRLGDGAPVEELAPGGSQNTGTFTERVLSHARLLLRSPELTPFRADESLLKTTSNGSKNYDNATQYSYGAIVAARIIAQLSSDPREQVRARMIARRAGSFLRSRCTYALGTPMFYKGDIFFTIWQGHAFIELFQLTGDRSWLALAQAYVDTAVRPLQQASGVGLGFALMAVSTAKAIVATIAASIIYHFLVGIISTC